MAPRVEVSTRQSETRQLRLSFYSGYLLHCCCFMCEWGNQSTWTSYISFSFLFFLNSSFLLDPPHFNRHGCHMLRISLTHLTWLKGPNIDSNVLVTNNRKDCMDTPQSKSVIYWGKSVSFHIVCVLYTLWPACVYTIWSGIRHRSANLVCGVEN